MSEFEEIFDVVDSDDQVIGCDTRSEVHRKNLLHRSVHAIVMNESGQVFLQLRGPHRDNNPDLWDSSVAGHLQSGEDYDQAMIRETEEEIGIRLERPPKRLFKLKASPTTDYEFCWIYKIVNGGPFEIDPNEAVEGRWFTPQELDDWMKASPEELTGCFRLIWKLFKEKEKL